MDLTEQIRSGSVDKLTFHNPPGVYDPAPNAYSQLAVFPPGSRIILPSGQGGETQDQVLSEDFATQFRQALSNVETVLAAAGATMSDVAKVNVLIVDYDEDKFDVYRSEFTRVWGDQPPTCTLIPVPALALKGMLVEIDVIAVAPA